MSKISKLLLLILGVIICSVQASGLHAQIGQPTEIPFSAVGAGFVECENGDQVASDAALELAAIDALVRLNELVAEKEAEGYTVTQITFMYDEGYPPTYTVGGDPGLPLKWGYSAIWLLHGTLVVEGEGSGQGW